LIHHLSLHNNQRCVHLGCTVPFRDDCISFKEDFVMSKHDDQSQLAKGKVQVGDSAPDFTLPDQSGKPVSLGEFLGKTDIVLYFYPRDNTAVCTAHEMRNEVGNQKAEP